MGDESVNSVKNSLTKAVGTKSEAPTAIEPTPKPEIEGVEQPEEEYEFTEPKYIKFEVPSWEYYCANESSKPTTSLTLKEASKRSNDITNFGDWCDEVGFSMPYDPYCLMDDHFIYKLYGKELNGTNWSQYMLDICDLSAGDPMYTLDFSDFYMADNVKEGDEFFADENIHWVVYKDDILYISIYHNTYAESAPHNGYIMAIDTKDDYKILWKTEPLTCNSDNFIVTDDAVICGYGFTKEDDFVYVLDRNTGERVQTYKVKTGPDWLHMDVDKLYVRCYDTDYVFEVIDSDNR